MAKKLEVAFFNLPAQNLLVEDDIHSATSEIIRSGTVIGGPYTLALEQWLTDYTGFKHAVLVGSGTSALSLAGKYWAKKDPFNSVEVTMPAFSFRATANAFLNLGPLHQHLRLLDVEPDGTADFSKDDGKFRTGGRIPLSVSVGMFGQANRWSDHCDIHDGAQSWLAIKNTNNEGPDVTVSFDPTKNLSAMGNGGAILTNSALRADDYRLMAANAVEGVNSRMSEFDAAVVLAKTKYISQWQQRRKDIAAYWIDNLPDQFTPIITEADLELGQHALQKFPVFIKDMGRNLVIQALKEAGIETKIHYDYTLYEAFRKWVANYDLYTSLTSVSSVLSTRLISLPFYPELTDAQVEYMAKVLNDISARKTL